MTENDLSKYSFNVVFDIAQGMLDSRAKRIDNSIQETKQQRLDQYVRAVLQTLCFDKNKLTNYEQLGREAVLISLQAMAFVDAEFESESINKNPRVE